MHTVSPLLATDHIRELRAEADASRLASNTGGRDTTWRRRLGSAARRLSVALSDLAVRLDPGAAPLLRA